MAAAVAAVVAFDVFCPALIDRAAIPGSVGLFRILDDRPVGPVLVPHREDGYPAGSSGFWTVLVSGAFVIPQGIDADFSLDYDAVDFINIGPHNVDRENKLIRGELWNAPTRTVTLSVISTELWLYKHSIKCKHVAVDSLGIDE